ncbi:alpha/beta hydrolase [Nocardia sp. NPDC059240]|uniref:alpha/beta hydrolase n=1 Tax=Nocardia sp. NPDC059240 TaxID=3346786 RepID=UPI003698C4C2
MTSTVRRRHGLPALLAVIGLTVVAACGSDHTAPAAIPVPTLTWQACPAATDGNATTQGFDCATAEVPIDYSNPAGGNFHLAVIRHPATDTGRRLGTLFWNPGGPSDAGTQYLPAAINGFPAEVLSRFDIVSWDPRGMGGRTTPVLQCFDSATAETQFMTGAPPQALPVTDDQMRAFVDFQQRLNTRCTAHAGDLANHVSTADNARDLDLLRQAVGDDELSYYGTSYGTFLGATYLQMFPGHTRAAVLDGAIDPTAWATDTTDPDLTTFLRARSDLGMAATFKEFLRQCGLASTTHCAFAAENPEATQAKWDELMRRTAAHPITLDGDTADNLALLTSAQSALYLTTPLPGFGRFPGWPAVGDMIQQAWQASGTNTPASTPTTTPTPSATAPTPSATTPSASATTPPPAAASTYTTSIGRQRAVICGESPSPATVDGYLRGAHTSYTRAGYTPWPWGATCLGWTVHEDNTYTGPWDRAASTPVLVIGNTFDPATAYDSSKAMAAALPGARLLTVDGYGHTELLNPSACAQSHIADYLINGALPAPDTVCKQNKGPFE